MRPVDLLPGATLGNYEIMSVLGRGGMAVVYLARDRRLGRNLALKVLSPELAEDEDFRSRFEREIRIAATLEHPNIVPVYDAGDVEGLLFLAMRYVDGIDLGQLLARHGSLDPGRTLAILRQVADALDTAHSNGLVHRDVKPGNILILPTSATRASDHVYLADFGLTRHVIADEGQTHAGEFFGTPDYAAPEQLLGRLPDARTDVYALACVAFECLVGEPPFRRDSPLATAAAQLSEDPPNVSERRSDLSGSVDEVLAKALGKDRTERPAECGAFIRDLEGVFPLGNVRTRPLVHGPRAVAVDARKVITVLFCDLVGSTAFAEGRDPEDTRALLRRFHQVLREQVESFGGVLEKFIGDAAMAVFGAPKAHGDDAERAVLAAFSIKQRLEEAGFDLDVRVGINTGEAVVTVDSDPSSGEGMVAGDTVNTASRLQSLAPEGSIVVGARTVAATRARIEYEALPPVLAKGKSVPLEMYRAVRPALTEQPLERVTPFVGRQTELILIDELFERAVTTSTTELLLVVGEAGIGKTRLLHQVRHRAETRALPIRWYLGRCLPYGNGVAFSAFRQIVRAAIGAVDSDSEQDLHRKLRSAVGEDLPWVIERLRPLVGATAPLDIPEREETFLAWRRFVEIMAERGPLVLAIEDLHWADPGMTAFVRDLLAHSVALPLIVIATSRGDSVEGDPGLLTGGSRTTLLTIGDLPPREMHSLAAALLDDEESELAALVSERAGGNPLFVEQLASAILERSVTGAGSLGHELPLSLRGVISSRLDALPAPERSALQDASILGAAWVSGVAALGDRAPDEVHKVMRELLRRGYLRRPTSSSIRGGEDVFAFSHELVRDVAYAEISRAGRAAKHESAARWLESSAAAGAEEAEITAHHFREALRFAKSTGSSTELEILARRAAHWFTVAADRLSATDARCAMARYRRALALLSHQDSERLNVQRSAGHCAVRVGRWSSAIGLLSPLVNDSDVQVLKDLGMALCKLHRDDPEDDDYRLGQALLGKAVASTADPDALASLAGTWRGVDDALSLELYLRALDTDPSDPYALGNVIEFEVAARQDMSAVEARRVALEDAIERRERQASVGRDLPWALYDLGKFALLLGDQYKALSAYAHAVEGSAAAYMVQTSRDSVLRLGAALPELSGGDSVSRFLALALSARFRSDSPEILGGSPAEAFEPPVIVLAGGSDIATHDAVWASGAQIVDALSALERATIVSGGTAQGVGDLAGEVAVRNPGVRVIGYLPEQLPTDAIPDPDRYSELRRTPGADFGLGDALGYWSDLLGSGCRSGDVTIVAIGGGQIAGAEFEIALALGARVMVAPGSGGSAERLLEDRVWLQTGRLLELPDSDVELGRILGGR